MADNDSDVRAARRIVVLLGVSLVALLVGVVVLAVNASLSGDPSTVDAALDDGDPTIATVTELGPPVGTDLNAYVGARRSVLGELRTPRVAVVSFTGYHDPDSVAAIIGPDVELLGRFAALPGGSSAFLAPDDEADAWRLVEQTAAAEERAEIELLLPSVDDIDFATFYRTESLRLSRTVDASADEPIFFGVAVRGSPAQLRVLAAHETVRFVDVGVGTVLADTAQLWALRPDETRVAGEPLHRS